MDNIPCSWIQFGSILAGIDSVKWLPYLIGGFHVTQVSLIITQVKNKIAYHLINWVKKLKYRRGIINKQRAKISGMCDIPNSSYSAKL